MKTRSWTAVLTLATLAAAALPQTTTTPPATAPPGPRSFEMKEFSFFDNDPSTSYMLTTGQRTRARDSASPNIKYPAFKGPRPLYGALTLTAGASAGSVTEYHFALDGPAAKNTASQPAPEGDAPTHPLVNYDTLYLDLNGDRDLTNDTPIKRHPKPPAMFATSDTGEGYAAFDYVQLNIGAGNTKRSVKALPLFMTYTGTDYSALSFVSPVARKGTVQIGSKWYELVLGQGHRLSGRYDLPDTYAALTRKTFFGNRQSEDTMGMPTLGMLRRVDNKYYQLSATETGDKVTIAPYTGDMGTLALSAGKRTIDDKDLAIQTAYLSGASTVALTNAGKKLEIPAGDYTLSYLVVRFGRHTLALSQNPYGNDGAPSTQPAANSTLQIRKNNPIVLDFAATPTAILTTPPAKTTLKPGDTLDINAALVDTQRNLLYRGISTKDPPAELAATATVKDAAGNQLFAGKMPFG